MDIYNVNGINVIIKYANKFKQILRKI